jgi:transposase
VPSLRPGQIVLLDNLAVHKSATAQALIEAAGCQLVFLPPYSPDFNPIEQAFAEIKQALRRRGARSWDAVAAAVADLVPRSPPPMLRPSLPLPAFLSSCSSYVRCSNLMLAYVHLG